MSTELRARWQSIAETLALVVIALAVGRIAITKPIQQSSSTKAATARRPEVPLPVQPIGLTDAHTAGSKAAKVALVVYSDFECPYCGKFARETLPAIEEQYVRTGKVLLAFRQFPLPNHQFAQKAAEGAVCAGRQGKFWPFHDELFANQQRLDPTSLQERARGLGLRADEFAICLAGQAAPFVQAEKIAGQPLGVVGTPTFLAGPLLKDGRVKVTERFSGALPLAQFQSILDRLVGT